MPTLTLAALALALFTTGARADDEPLLPKKPDWMAKAVKKVEFTLDPTEAKPGQTVTAKLTVELNPGYTTYPSKQKEAAAAGMVNKLEFPKPGPAVFVGDVTEPENPKKKAEPDLGISELLYYEGTLTYSRKFVVNPSQAAGEATIKLAAFKLMVCDASSCFPGKTLTPEAKLTVLAGAATVEAAHAEEVKKALDAAKEAAKEPGK